MVKLVLILGGFATVVCSLKTFFAGKLTYGIFDNFFWKNRPGSGLSWALFVRWSLLLYTREILCLTHWFTMQEIPACSQDRDSMWITVFWLCCAIYKIWITTSPKFACFNLVPLGSKLFDFRGDILFYTERKPALEMLLTCSPTLWVKNMLSFPEIRDDSD